MTTHQIAAYKNAGSRQDVLRSLNSPSHARARVICLPWCGGGASGYRFLAERTKQIAVFAAQLPGREDRFCDSPYKRMDQLVESLVDALGTMTDLPLFIFGHSMGALAAYEVAHALRTTTGRSLDGLLVSGFVAPHCRPTPVNPLHLANDTEFINQIHKFGGTPKTVLSDAGMRNVILPSLRADFEVLETHVSQQKTPLACPILACAGLDDILVSKETIAAWRSCTTGTFRTQWFSGGHFYFQARPDGFIRIAQDWMISLAARNESQTENDFSSERRKYG